MSRSLSTYTHHNNVLADHDALFQVGLMDINNHKKQLETLRIAAGALGENGKKSRTFCARLRWKLSLCF
ncbi:hypothetical protein [Bartonella sp. MR30HLJHH]|uniref:hypothetical protein n=1 Tax=Bartonella sp. MR30HLJHH TaxID=3243557 RepID=UPI0035D10D73